MNHFNLFEVRWLAGRTDSDSTVLHVGSPIMGHLFGSIKVGSLSRSSREKC